TAKEDGEEKPAEKKESRYRVVISKWDDEKADRVDRPVDTEDKDDKKSSSDRAFTFRRVQQIEGKNISYSETKIESPPLQDLLGKIMESRTGEKSVTEMYSPFRDLIHEWSEAEKATESQEDDSEDDKLAREDLKELLKIISESSGIEKLTRYFKEREQLRKDKKIRHETLWTLFPAGAFIVARPFLGVEQVLFVQSTDVLSMNTLDDNEEDPFQVVCYMYDWDGEHFNRVPVTLEIDYFKDKKSIIELPFFPLEFYETEGCTSEEAVQSLKDRLVERGRKYRELCVAPRGMKMFRYEGPACYQRNSGIFRSVAASGDDDDSRSQTTMVESTSGVSSESTISRTEVKGTVMVDFKSYFAYSSQSAPILGDKKVYDGANECNCADCRATKSKAKVYRYDWDRKTSSTGLTEEQFMCCPPRVLGYSMEKKGWMQLQVSKVRTWDQSEEQSQIFHKKLQLNDTHKQLIEKSVRAHETGKSKDGRGGIQGIDDFAEGKGKGLTILLYGVPGVGKTLTAESVAILARKPLFSVGVSDIGTEGSKVEENLQKIFDLAGLWEAVLLFDEADVFLESRGRSGDTDLRRNAMVSVLLRVLEYYEGILILTTNRMRTFDIAVQSRIHLAIKYDDLSKSQREKIFMAFLDQLNDKYLVDDFSEVKEWVEVDGCEFDFNGRQIRNVVSTAMGLARAEN
ncbi:P-loop containing nucleoside triphosphate hydrolase protein, partial [Saccharata proteae CBS 121410]